MTKLHILTPSGGSGYREFKARADDYERCYRRDFPSATITRSEIDAMHMSGTEPVAEKQAETESRIRQTLASFDGLHDVQDIAIFCHGWRTGFQLGFNLRTVFKLSAAIVETCRPDVRIALYACSMGADVKDNKWTPTRGTTGDGGIADLMRDQLVAAGLRPVIDAHATAGHTTRNPYVRRCDSSTYVGGVWLVDPSDKSLWPLWLRKIEKTDIELRMTRMSIQDIHSELRRK